MKTRNDSHLCLLRGYGVSADILCGRVGKFQPHLPQGRPWFRAFPEGTPSGGGVGWGLGLRANAQVPNQRTGLVCSLPPPHPQETQASRGLKALLAEGLAQRLSGPVGAGGDSPHRGQERTSWKDSRMEDRRSVRGQVWGWVSQARPVLGGPEDRTSVGMVEAEGRLVFSCVAGPQVGTTASPSWMVLGGGGTAHPST